MARASHSPAAGGERGEDTFRPGVQGGFHQGAVQLAQNMVYGRGVGGLIMRQA